MASDDSLAKAAPGSQAKGKAPKRGRVSAKKDPYMDEDMIMSSKSKLIGADLVVCQRVCHS